MDLTIEDVSDLLNVAPKKITEWIDDGHIPCYRINSEFRFSRLEIENWMLKKESLESHFKEQNRKSTKGGNKQFNLFRALHKGGVLHQVPGITKNEVIRNAMETIAKDLNVDQNVLTDLLIDRETLQSTGIGHGIGLPHTRDSFVRSANDYVYVAFPSKPIEDYGALDGQPVHTLFFLFASDDKRHLHLLAKIAHFTSQPPLREALLERPNKAHLLETIRKWEAGVGSHF